MQKPLIQTNETGTGLISQLLCSIKMKTAFKFTTIAGLLAILIALALFLAIGKGIYSGKGSALKFVNASGHAVSSAKITVAGKSCSFKGLANGGEVNCYFENLYDSSYSVSVTLDSGSKYTAKSLGYVTGGIDFNDRITINNAGEFKVDSSIST